MGHAFNIKLMWCETRSIHCAMNFALVMYVCMYVYSPVCATVLRTDSRTQPGNRDSGHADSEDWGGAQGQDGRSY